MITPLPRGQASSGDGYNLWQNTFEKDESHVLANFRALCVSVLNLHLSAYRCRKLSGCCPEVFLS